MPTPAVPPPHDQPPLDQPPLDRAAFDGRPRPPQWPTGSPVILLRAAHPAPALAVTAIAAVLAAAGGRGAIGGALVTLAVLAGQLCIGWTNDLIDRHRDATARRTDKPLATGALTPPVVGVAAGCAGAACVPLSLACGPVAGAAHLVGVAAGLAYDAALKRTRWSWLPYAVAFGLLPVFVLAGPGRSWPPPWLPGAAALLGLGAHLTNVLPDIEADLAAGVRGLPQRLGPTRSRVLAAIVLLAASALLVLAPPGDPTALGWAGLGLALVVALVATWPRLHRADSRLPFLLTIALAGLDLVLLLLPGAGRR